MKYTGIWMDKEKAFIIDSSQIEEEMITIPSQVETYKIHGGSGTRIKGGPQDVVQDSKYLEREKNQFKAYFKEIVSRIKNSDKIAVFGPAEAGEKFRKELELNHKNIAIKLEGVFKADSMTKNQIRALVRDYFTKNDIQV